MSVKVIHHLINSIRSSSDFNSEAESRPQCILWTDKDKQWVSTMAKLRIEMPELLIFGEYDPENFTGPAIWIRVAIEGLIESYRVPYGRVPIIYLPGISRQDLRAVEHCQDLYKPIAELQYRGVIWSQVNSRDWTIYAYLKTRKGGLGLNIPQDDLTINAMERSIIRFLDEDINAIKEEYLDKDFFNSLLTGGDPVKDILTWMANPELFKNEKSSEEWMAFVEICTSKFKFHPEQDGILGAGEKLAWHDVDWDIVWDRFCEAPAKYNVVPSVLRKTVMPFGISQERSPQWNEQQELTLQKELKKLEGLTEVSARKELIKLEEEHGKRRDTIWSNIGESPLANSLFWIAKVAKLSENIISGDYNAIENNYSEWGWTVDDAVIRALQMVSKQEDMESVISAIRSTYLPWLDENARLLSKVFKNNEHLNFNNKNQYRDNECYCFVDGLRFDLAKRLSEKLRSKGYEVKESVRLAKLPTVTATCKPALTPIYDYFVGGDTSNEDFAPILKETGQSITNQKLESLITQAGWKVLKNMDIQKNEARYGWFEFGNIDEDGHNMGWRMIYNIERHLDEAVDKIISLTQSGWESVKIITDHGWLIMPKGLPKTTLPVSMTESKWGRCAAIKQGALFDGSYYQWYWNENVQFALAEGVSCYRASMEYTHGGISLEECILLDLEVTSKKETTSGNLVTVTDVLWKGMRCKIAIEGQYYNTKLDIRTKPALPDSSIVMNIKEVSEAGIASVVVDDDKHEGKQVYIVLIDHDDSVIYQITTTVGGDN